MTPNIIPITEDDIAQFLANTPDFFERHAEVLAAVQLTSPHGNRAISLQERQVFMLREKVRFLELRLQDMIRNGNENMQISARLHRWACQLFLVPSPVQLPEWIASEIRLQFNLPQASVKVWDVAPAYADEPFALGVSEDAKIFTSSLAAPYCGANAGFESVAWLDEPAQARSLALVPLRPASGGALEPAFGLLVLASSDAQRFHAGMGTEFLERIADIASAALSRLRQP
jgi:uncharacterized protein YigA (DUF484 family)